MALPCCCPPKFVYFCDMSLPLATISWAGFGGPPLAGLTDEDGPPISKLEDPTIAPKVLVCTYRCRNACLANSGGSCGIQDPVTCEGQTSWGATFFGWLQIELFNDITRNDSQSIHSFARIGSSFFPSSIPSDRTLRAKKPPWCLFHSSSSDHCSCDTYRNMAR